MTATVADAPVPALEGRAVEAGNGETPVGQRRLDNQAAASLPSTWVPAPTAPTTMMSGPASEPAASREVFLDAVRTVAIIRVVLWHTLGAAVLTYFVAAVPAMFFVTGSLLAKSLRRGAGRVVLDRARRILVPLWGFGLVAYVTMAVSHAVDGTARTAVPWKELVFWVFPVVDPHGSAWEGGYMSSPLWYLRALLWLIVLSPWLLRLVRRSAVVAMALPLAILVLLEVLDRTGAWPVTNSWAWRMGDAALYGIFLMGGFLHRDGRLNGMTRRRWLFAMLALGCAAAAWCTTQSIPDHVVNNSHIAHLLVGGAWLSAFFVARPWIERLATARAGAAFLSWINKRTITIYLWHSTAVVVSFELLRAAAPQWNFGTWSVALLAMTACVTLVFVLVFGWVEDFANRRPRRLWAGSSSSTRGATAPATPASPARRWHMPRPAMAAAVLGSLVLVAAADPGAFLGPEAATTTGAAGAQVAGTGGATTTAAPSTTAAGGTAVLGTTASRGSRLRIPSQQPKAPTFTTATGSASGSTTNATTHNAATTPSASVGSTTVTTVPTSSDAPWLTSGSDVTDPTVAARLQAAVRQWMTDNAVPGAEVAIFRPGSVDWETAIGTDPANGDQIVSVGTSFDIASVTKTFTAALVWQLADQGLINVDEPIGTLAEVPDFPYTELTVRQLLSHTSGLVNFRDTPEFVADPNSIDTPQAALEAAGRQPLQFTPGTQSFYSTTNYLVLGFLLEQLTGETFDSLVAGLANDAGIGPIPHAPATGGYPNFSVAGLEMTAGQLAHWGLALLGANTPGLSDSARQTMANINPSSALGAGLWGYCPCAMVDGEPQWAAIGHSGSTTELQYSPATDIAIVVNLTDSIWAPDNRQDAVIALVAQLRAIALGEA